MRLDHLLSMETKSDETSWFKFQGQHYERFLFKTRCLIFRVLPEIYGGIAQLGEHLLCKQGVSGSIPLISTTGLRKLNTKHGLVAQVVRAHA